MSDGTKQCRKYRAQALVCALALTMLAGCSEKEATAPQETMSADMPAEQGAAPAAPPAPEAPAPAIESQAAAAGPAAETPAAAMDGQTVYQTYCTACHQAGVAGAPKLGDKEAWAPRIAKGMDALFTSVTNGLNAMPPKGTCMTCSDEELRAAIEYMVGESS